MKMQCTFCGVTENIEFHHIFPKALGGCDDGHNIIPLCTHCHDKMPKYTTTNFFGFPKTHSFRMPKNIKDIIELYAWYHRKNISQVLVEMVCSYFMNKDNKNIF